MTAWSLADWLPPSAGDWWRLENPLGPQVVDRLANSVTTDSPEIFRFFAKEYEDLRDRLGESLPTWIIHGDLFPDNTLFSDGELVAFLDYVDACEDTYLDRCGHDYPWLLLC